ncbi:MAG: hypothetical protein ABFS41_18675 [Myxococcota bacterium]
MNEPACTAFRRALGSALAPRGARGEPPEDVELGWHEHLLACPSCRAFLAAEQALDVLLATLPRPRLSGDLARRVLARLAGARAPERTGERLDDLLDLLPSPAAPDDLAARTLRGLAPERQGGRRSGRRLRLVRRGRRVAAAVLVVASVLWLVLGGRDEPQPEGRVAGEVEDELLETLDVLENWELLMSDDLDLVLAELDAVDWTLLEYGSEEADVPGDAEGDDGEERGG